MTGFERYIESKGYKLYEGELKEFNTYDNCNRTWINDKGYRIMIGLYAKPTRVGILVPFLYTDDSNKFYESFDKSRRPYDSLPTEEQYEDVLKVCEKIRKINN